MTIPWRPSDAGSTGPNGRTIDDLSRDRGEHRDRLGGGSVGVEIGQDDGQVLGVGQEADNVGVIRPNEVEPSDRRAFDSSDSESWNVAQLADAW